MKINKTAAPDRLTLRTTPTSPYGRKTRMAVLVHGLAQEIDIVPADTLDESDTLRVQNPLGKMPCLLLPDGRVIFDSRVIIEYLDSLSQRPPLIPADGAARIDTLTAASLCDGLTDAALLMVYEHRFREPEQVSQRWLTHQQGKIERALAAFSAAPPRSDHTDVVSIGLACALAYLDWRQPMPWRQSYPVLVDWLQAFSAHEPAFNQTAAPDA